MTIPENDPPALSPLDADPVYAQVLSERLDCLHTADPLPVPKPAQAPRVWFMVDPELDPAVCDRDDDSDDGLPPLFTGFGELPSFRVPTRLFLTAARVVAEPQAAQPEPQPVADSAPALVPALDLPAGPCTAVADNEPGMDADAIVSDFGVEFPLSPEYRVSKRIIAALPGIDVSAERPEVIACLNCLVTNMVRASDFDLQAWVSVSRTREWWSAARKKWPEWASHGNMIKALGLLTKPGRELADEEVAHDGHLVVWKDAAGVVRQGRQSRYRARPALVAALRDVDRFDRRPGAEIRMVGKDKKPMAVRMTTHVERMAKQVQRYNTFMAQQDVRLPTQDAMCAHPDLEITETRSGLTITRTDADGRKRTQHLCPTPAVTIFRSFPRGSWQCGGRVYNWIQSLSSELREQLLINGQAVVELDFKSLHPCMLYARRGLQMQGLAYDLGEHEVPGVSRDDIKIAMLVAVNARGRRYGTMKALMARATLTEDPWLHDEATTLAVYDALLARHAPIKDDFGSDMGVRLMKTDSDMMMRILLRCVDANIPAVSVHDSVVCPRSHWETIRGFMREEWDADFPGIEIGISVSPQALVDNKTSDRNSIGSSYTSIKSDLLSLVTSFPASPGPLGLPETLDPLVVDNLDLQDSLDRVRETSGADVVGTMDGRCVGKSKVPYVQASLAPAGASRTSLIANLKVLAGGLSDRVDLDEEISHPSMSSMPAGRRGQPGIAASLKTAGARRKAPKNSARPSRRPAPQKAFSAASLGRQAKARQVAEPAPVKQVALPASVPLFGDLPVVQRPEVPVKGSRLAQPLRASRPAPVAPVPTADVQAPSPRPKPAPAPASRFRRPRPVDPVHLAVNDPRGF
jgi:hypothetical protein